MMQETSTEFFEIGGLPQMSMPESVEDVQESVSAFSAWISEAGTKVLQFFIQLGICIVLFLAIRKMLDKLLTGLSAYMSRRHVEGTAQHFIVAFIRYSVLGFTLVGMAVQLHIVQAASIAALIASAGVGISLAMQGALSNFAGGILLLILKPFREGDYIVVSDAGVEGTVTKIELYYTTVRTLYGSMITVPNSELTNHAVQNMSAGHQKFLVVKVGISYRQDIEQARKLLEEIQAAQTRYVQGTTAVIVDELGENAVIMAVRGAVAAADYYPVMWAVNEAILTRFKQEGIEIPYNQLSVHVVHDDKGR